VPASAEWTDSHLQVANSVIDIQHLALTLFGAFYPAAQRHAPIHASASTLPANAVDSGCQPYQRLAGFMVKPPLSRSGPLTMSAKVAKERSYVTTVAAPAGWMDGDHYTSVA
jgi:hypothetical protein